MLESPCRLHSPGAGDRALTIAGCGVGAMEERFAVLQLSDCSGCEASLLNADEWIDNRRLLYVPLVISSDDVPSRHTACHRRGVYCR